MWSCAAAATPGSDDEPIVIVDEPFASTAPPAEAPVAADSDDEIIIIQEGETADKAAPVVVTGALGRLWETWHVAADSDLLGAVQLAPADDGAWRLLGGVWLESWLLPTPNLSLYGNGFGRVAFDGTPDGKLVPFADVYEAYAKVKVDRASVTLGRIVVPWGRTQAAALGDRLQPNDLRRGAPFPDAGRQKQPSWGAWLRTSVGSLSVEGIALAQYEQSEGSLAAANQGGVRVARYQTALVRSPARVDGLLADDDTRALHADYPLVATSTIAGRAWRRVGDIDLSTSVVWGYDETPRLHLGPDVARVLASELFVARGASEDAVVAPCDRVTLLCVGPRGTLENGRTTSMSLDASWGLGLVIVRAEAVVWPRLLGLQGKTAIVADDAGLRSVLTTQAAAAVAVEGTLGDIVDGSLELFDVAWFGLPAGALLWGVEPFGTDATALDATDRQVHRVAGAASLSGALLSDRVRWRVRGEAGVLQPDVLVSAELRYRLPVLGLYVGGRTDLFTGVPGSPGWMRQDASLLGVFVGEGS